MSKVIELNHPLVKHKLTQIRKKETNTNTFRQIVNELSTILAYEATKDLEVTDIEIETPLVKTFQPELSGENIAVVPIIRAGLGMVEGFTNLIPNAKIGHIGLYRDEETKQPIEYFLKLPNDIENREVFIVDPMLATGGSAIAAIDTIKKYTQKPIKLVDIVACPEGIEAVQKAHPDVDIITATIDEKLNDDKYILPGLGDAGDRLFGTL